MDWYVISILLAIAMFWAGIKLYLWGRENFSEEAKQRHIEENMAEKKRNREAAQKARNKILYRSFIFEIEKVGETNADGTCRQDILRRMKERQDATRKNEQLLPSEWYFPELTFEKFVPAVGAVEIRALLDGALVGVVPLEYSYLMEQLLTREYDAYPTLYAIGVDEEAGNTLIGLEVTVTYKRFPYELTEEEQAELRNLERE